MQDINTQVYSGMWVRLPHLVKERIAKDFGILRSGASHVVDGVVQADGYTDRDLAVLNVANLKNHLNSDAEDIFILWNTLVKKVQAELNPPKAAPVEEKPNVEMNIVVDGEAVKLTGVSKTKKNA